MGFKNAQTDQHTVLFLVDKLEEKNIFIKMELIEWTLNNIEAVQIIVNIERVD